MTSALHYATGTHTLADTRPADPLGDEVRAAIEDYRRIFPAPYALAPNLALASGLLAERDRLADIYDAVLDHARSTTHLTDQSALLAILNGDHA